MKLPKVGWVVNIFVVAGEVRGCGLEGQAACDVEVVVHAEAPIFFDQAESPFTKIEDSSKLRLKSVTTVTCLVTHCIVSKFPFGIHLMYPGK